MLWVEKKKIPRQVHRGISTFILADWVKLNRQLFKKNISFIMWTLGGSQWFFGVDSFIPAWGCAPGWDKAGLRPLASATNL